MLNDHCATGLRFARRLLPALLITATLLPWPSGPVSSVHADDETTEFGWPGFPTDPDARLQLIVKRIYVIDDADWWGKGEISLRFVVRRCAPPCQMADFDSDLKLVRAAINFSASSGSTLELSRPIPRGGDTVVGGVSEEVGIPLFAEAHYQLSIQASEDDLEIIVSFDPDNYITADLDASNGWGVGPIHGETGR